MDDMKLAMDKGIDAVIERRTQAGKRLAARFSDLPKGMSYMEFMVHPEIDELDLDFVTSSEMFNAYSGQTD